MAQVHEYFFKLTYLFKMVCLTIKPYQIIKRADPQISQLSFFKQSGYNISYFENKILLK